MMLCGAEHLPQSLATGLPWVYARLWNIVQLQLVP